MGNKECVDLINPQYRLQWNLTCKTTLTHISFRLC